MTVAQTYRVAVTDSTGAFVFRRVPPNRYALSATSSAGVSRYRWWREIAAERGKRHRVELARPADGHLSCFDPERAPVVDSVARPR
jgi:hypothetical protein